MAILKVYRTFKGESANEDREVHKYLVESDSKNTTCTQARTANDGTVSIPATYSLLEGTTWTAAVEARRMDSNPKWFEVTVTYRKATVEAGSFPKEQKPEEGGKWNMSILGRTMVYEEEVYKAKNSSGVLVEIANSAGQRFENGIMKQYFDQELVVRFDTDSPNWNAIRDTKGKVNDAEVTITIKGVTRVCPQGTLRFINADWSLSFDQATSANEAHVAMELTFAYRHEGWGIKKIDEGFYIRNTGTTSGREKPLLKIIDNLTGEWIQKPAFLKDGQLLPDGDPVELLEFFIYEEASFDDLLDGV